MNDLGKRSSLLMLNLFSEFWEHFDDDWDDIMNPNSVGQSNRHDIFESSHASS